MTGLIWAADGSGAGCHYGQTLNWNGAVDWANGLTFAGRGDWRLPNVRELHSLVTFSRSSPSIHSGYFPNVQADYYYWSSTSLSHDLASAPCVDFQYGSILHLKKTATYAVRVVRFGR